MIEKRSFDSLGHFQNGWLNAKHHFSFGGYFDKARLGWGALRVWNDDEIQPGEGFAPHPHRDMEIITYVRKGAITHRDNLGNEGRTEAGDVQVMSAGAGIMHSEFNREDELTRIFQIWIVPETEGGEPRWDAMEFPKGDRAGDFVVLASGNPDRDGGLMIRQDARVLGATLTKGQSVTYPLAQDRQAYLVLAEGRAMVGELELDARDGAAIRDAGEITITALDDTEIVLVETN